MSDLREESDTRALGDRDNPVPGPVRKLLEIYEGELAAPGEFAELFRRSVRPSRGINMWTNFMRRRARVDRLASPCVMDTVRVAVVVFIVAAAMAPAEAGPCKYHHDLGFLPAVLTPDHATLDLSGGGVVAAESVRLDRAVDGDPTLQDWRFSDGTHDVVGKRTVIAPGLIVTAPVGLGDTLVFKNPDGSHVRQIRYRSTADRATLPAPKVDSVIHSNGNLGIMLRELTTAKLAAPAPAGVVALVVYAGSTPRSWVAINDPQRLDVSVYAVDDCVLQIPGTIATRAGDRITLAWVDATGHVSTHTPTMVVGKR